jgi:hypothetical protein
MQRPNPPQRHVPERRKTTDRRQGWRGGRRDSDWTSRPSGALARIEPEPPAPSAWQRLLALVRA